MPTSQSARLRPLAASANRSYSLPGRSLSNPLRMASGVSEEIQSRLTGLLLSQSATPVGTSGSFAPLRTDLWFVRIQPVANGRARSAIDRSAIAAIED